MTEPIIQVENLTAGYNERKILQNISLDIYPNEIVVILGTSGCGKTTLLKHLIGLLTSKEGKVKLFGKDINNLYDKELIQIKKRIGVLFQNGALLNSITIAENIAIPLKRHYNLSQAVMDRIVHLKLSLVGLDHVYNFFPNELSGGMRKRAALARAISLDPQLFFVDEPGAGLDPVTAEALDKLLLSLKNQLGMTLVVVTHEVASIKRIADKICYLSKGNILFYDTLDKALKSDIPEINNFFNSAGR
ncbi:MAG: ATP-binding cassette domain-containing protein [Bacteroidetes bacterium]|nr:ATP-binding cassette domain-containing protein [Bacteroidota bacterium]MBU2508251.1 ATP-binding cassette domain-containing protein [Bacteroidota bacterium]